MNLPLFIGLRYTRAKRRNGFISFISLTSMIVIALGVWALITTMSIMNGFERELRGRILDVASHVTVSGYAGSLTNWQELSSQMAVLDGVTGFAPYVDGQGLVTHAGEVTGTIVRGINPELEIEVSELQNHLRYGRFSDLVSGEYRIILGNALARRLGVTIGSKVTLIAPQGQSTAAGMVPRLRRFTVSGLFDIGMYEYDSALALVHIEDAARLFRLGDDVSGIRLKLEDVYQAPLTGRTLSQQLGYDYYVSDWTQEHRNFFRALAVEKRVMFIILFLIIVVAAFNIVSTLVMVVTDKQSDIAILRTLGLAPLGVMGVFFVQGTLVGVIGTLAGGLFGVLTALNVETLVPWLENLFGFKLFPPDIYVITDFPAELHWSDVNTIVIASLCMSMLATLYPAWRASRTQPAEALRYE